VPSDISDYPKIMGVLNCTPDSFSDGGAFFEYHDAMVQAERLIAAGANIIDVGGESTRPGAQTHPISAEEEMRRVIPVIRDIKKKFDIAVSVDTSSAQVMQAAIDVGVDLLNDVRAFQDEEAFRVALHSNTPLCVMHMQGDPRNMQISPQYHNVVDEVYAFLQKRIQAFREAGFKQTIMVDPGFGFGKRLADNLRLLRELSHFKTLNCPLLVGLSRKTMIGELTGKNEKERLAGSLAAVSLALWHGADMIRVHDVAETVDAMKVILAVKA